METIKFFTTLQLGWLNAWIPTLFIMLAQMLIMMTSKEAAKRAMDTSWFTAKDKKRASYSAFLQYAILLLAIFVPFKTGTTWFIDGAILYLIGLYIALSSAYTYTKTPLIEPITKGVYKISRNPMYFGFEVALAGVCIACASLWFLITLVLFCIATHLLIESEEEFCTKIYGEGYLNYKNKVARYFWFF